jgi:hypothetical protein
VKLIAAVAFVVALVAGARPARADGALIALLPLGADAKLSIYGQPVASELARSLEGAGFSIVVVTSTAPVPAKARLVIDGRIVKGAGGAVLLEARVRDPGRGTIVSELSASAPSLTRIDEAVAELAKRLGDVLHAGLQAQDEERARPRPAPATVTHDAAPVKKKVDRRPLALVSIFSAAPRGPDDPAMEPLLHAGAIDLAAQLGRRSADLRGEDVPAALRSANGDIAVHIELLEIEYGKSTVATARARARVRVVRGDKPIFDRVVRTDTLVGGRGDRRDAVARAAVAQIVDIAMPRVRERLEAKK